MTRTKAPFDADLNLGPLPRKQTIRVVAYGPTGRSVGEDEYIVNEGREVFRVRILTPEKGAKVVGPDARSSRPSPSRRARRSRSSSSTPTRPASRRSTRRPTSRPSTSRTPKSLGYVRVVGTLDDGARRRGPALRQRAGVRLGGHGRRRRALHDGHRQGAARSTDLQASNFKVFEDGVIQKIEGFEYVKNLPLSVGLLIDTSASMLESLPEAAAGRAEVPRLLDRRRRTARSSSPSTTSRTCSRS